MLSRQRISVPQLPQEDGGRRSDCRAGTRATTTFRKLPSASAGARTTSARPVVIDVTRVTVTTRRSVSAGAVLGGRLRRRRCWRLSRLLPSDARSLLGVVERDQEVVPIRRRVRRPTSRSTCPSRTRSDERHARTSASRRTRRPRSRPGSLSARRSRISSAMRALFDHHLDRRDPPAAERGSSRWLMTPRSDAGEDAKRPAAASRGGSTRSAVTRSRQRRSCAASRRTRWPDSAAWSAT